MFVGLFSTAFNGKLSIFVYVIALVLTLEILGIAIELRENCFKSKLSEFLVAFLLFKIH